MGISAGTVIRGATFWRKNEVGKWLIRRFLPKLAAKREPVWAQRAARKARRQRQPDEAAGEFFQPEGDPLMSPLILALLGGFARTVVPAATAYLAGLGIALPGGTADIMLVALAGVVWIAMQAWSLLRKRFTLPETLGSLARVFLPTLTAFSAGQGVVGDAGSMQSIMLSVVVAAAMVGWSWARKTMRAKTDATP